MEGASDLRGEAIQISVMGLGVREDDMTVSEAKQNIALDIERTILQHNRPTMTAQRLHHLHQLPRIDSCSEMPADARQIVTVLVWSGWTRRQTPIDAIAKTPHTKAEKVGFHMVPSNPTRCTCMRR